MDHDPPIVADIEAEGVTSSNSPATIDAATQTASAMSHKPAFSHKVDKRGRIYKLKRESEYLKFPDDSISGLSSSEQELDSDSTSSVLQNKYAVHETEEPTQSSAQDETSANKITYRAEFYHYRRPYRGEHLNPSLELTKEDAQPIPISQAGHRSSKSKGDSIFEITTMYAIPARVVRKSSSGERIEFKSSKRKGREITQIPSSGMEVLAKVATYITIHSELLLDILESIAGYYPDISFLGDTLVLQEPFCMLLHYRDEILERRDALKASVSMSDEGDNGELVAKHDHLNCLCEFIAQRYDEVMRQEIARHQEAQPMCTFDLIWLLFRPGTIVYAWESGNLLASVVHGHSRETKHQDNERVTPATAETLDDLGRNKREDFWVEVWHLEFDGQRIGRKVEGFRIPSFDGQKSITSLPVFPKEYLKYDQGIDRELSTEEKLVRRGKVFFEMTKRSYMQYDGKGLGFPNRTVSFTAMVDL